MSLRSLEWMWAGLRWPPTHRPSCKLHLWVPVCYHVPDIYPFHLYYSAIRPILILPFTEGRRLSWSRHYSKCVKPMPKAVYRSGFREKHRTCLQHRFNPGTSCAMVRCADCCDTGMGHRICCHISSHQHVFMLCRVLCCVGEWHPDAWSDEAGTWVPPVFLSWKSNQSKSAAPEPRHVPYNWCTYSTFLALLSVDCGPMLE